MWIADGAETHAVAMKDLPSPDELPQLADRRRIDEREES